MRLLVVEDDRRTASFIRRGLVAEGFSVDACHDGQDALHLTVHEPYDAVVLDLVIPKMDGFEVLRQARQAGASVPVLVLSSVDAVDSRIRALNQGADDFMTKPFSFGELTARIRALLRRRSSSISPALRVDDLDVDPVRRRVSRGGRRISLTPKEFALLEYLVRNVGNVLTRAMIAEHVWDHHFDTFTNIIDVHIRYLRVKVDEGFATRLIHTVRGVGYMLSPDGP